MHNHVQEDAGAFRQEIELTRFTTIVIDKLLYLRVAGVVVADLETVENPFPGVEIFVDSGLLLLVVTEPLGLVGLGIAVQGSFLQDSFFWLVLVCWILPVVLVCWSGLPIVLEQPEPVKTATTDIAMNAYLLIVIII